MKPWTCIFDWDGVVIDSSALHERSWEMLAGETGLVLADGYFKLGFGMKNQRIIPDLLGWTRDPDRIEELALRKEEHYRMLLRREGIQPLPGVRELLQDLQRHRIPAIVGSSTTRKNIDCALEVLGFDGLFAGIVSGDDVSKGKPDPEVFLKAAALGGSPPARSLVIEDAHVGIEAARAAGMKVLAVATTHPVDSLREADRAVFRLTEVDATQLAGFFG